MNKEILYSNVTVYHDMVPQYKEFIEFLKESENEVGGKYYFNEWNPWYKLGSIMNTSMPDKEHPLSNEFDNIPHALKQKEFMQKISDVFFATTQDFIKENKIELPKWQHSGLSVCKYWLSHSPEHFALAYHTDTHEFDKESPGNKFAVTCTIYLSDDFEGGEISFLDESTGKIIEYKPKAGDAIVFPSGAPYYHGVKAVTKGERYLIRTWWFEDYPGSSEWFANQDKYGKEVWAEMEKERIQKEFDSGKWHRYVVPLGGSLDPNQKSKPFFLKE